MGSDLYMAQRDFRPRPDKAEWVDDDIRLSKDYFMSGYKAFYQGPLTDEIKVMMKGLGIKVPPKPSALKEYTISFLYKKPGHLSAKLSAVHFDTREKIIDRLLSLAMDHYDISESSIDKKTIQLKVKD